MELVDLLQIIRNQKNKVSKKILRDFANLQGKKTTNNHTKDQILALLNKNEIIKFIESQNLIQDFNSGKHIPIPKKPSKIEVKEDFYQNSFLIERYIDIEQFLLLKDGSSKSGSEINIGDKLLTMDGNEKEVISKELVKKKKFKITFTSKYDEKKTFNVIDILTLHWNSSAKIHTKKSGNYQSYDVKYFEQIVEKDFLQLKKRSKSFNKNIGDEQALAQAKEFLELKKNNNYIIHQSNPSEYMLVTNRDKIDCYRFFQTEIVNFQPETNIDFDPYVLGVWLGDGTSSDPDITSADLEIIEELSKRIAPYNLEIKKINHKYGWRIYNSENQETYYFPCCNYIFKTKTAYNNHIASYSHIAQHGETPIIETKRMNDRNHFLTFLDKYNLRDKFLISNYPKTEEISKVDTEITRKFANNKHIPNNFKFTSKKNRLELLAGLIDTDGYLSGSKLNKGSCYEIIQKNTTLADDIIFVARSLGFYVHAVDCEKSCMYKGEKRTGIYRRMNICSTPIIDIKEIPVVLDRKKCTLDRNITQNRLHHGFTCEEVLEETYCWKLTFNKSKEEGYKDFALVNSDFLVI